LLHSLDLSLGIQSCHRVMLGVRVNT
jgi:hypothetical protein